MTMSETSRKVEKTDKPDKQDKPDKSKKAMAPLENRQLPVWHLPPLDRDEAEIEKAYQQEYKNGYDEGFKLGKQAGLKTAALEAAESTRQFSAMMNSVNDALRSNDVGIARELAELAGAIAEAVIRAEISLHPEHMVDMLQHLMSQLPGRSEQVELRLSPGDAAVLAERMEVTGVVAADSWRITSDAELETGDCVLTTRHSLLDATVVAQIKAIVADMMEDTE